MPQKALSIVIFRKEWRARKEARRGKTAGVSLLDSAPPDSSDDSGQALAKPPSRLGGTAVGNFGGKSSGTFRSGLRSSSEHQPSYSLPPHLYQDTSKITFHHESGQIYGGQLNLLTIKIAILFFREINFNTMNARLQYEIRGWAYWAKCLNPLRNTITIRNLPLGIELHAYKRDAVGRGLYRRKVHEPNLTKLLLTRFSNSAERNFIDAGANIGYFTCLMSKLAGPSGKILVIEPEPQNFALLEQNVKLNSLKNVALHRCALGASEGSAMLGLYKASNRGRHSIVDKNAKEQIKVPVRTLDDVAKNSGADIKSWSLMKIDVEGYEGFVLDGAKETLPRVETLVMEYSPALLRAAGRDPAATLQTLAAHFSRIHRIESTDLAEVTAEDCLRSETQVELIFDR